MMNELYEIKYVFKNDRPLNVEYRIVFQMLVGRALIFISWKKFKPIPIRKAPFNFNGCIITNSHIVFDVHYQK